MPARQAPVTFYRARARGKHVKGKRAYYPSLPSYACARVLDISPFVLKHRRMLPRLTIVWYYFENPKKHIGMIENLKIMV